VSWSEERLAAGQVLSGFAWPTFWPNTSGPRPSPQAPPSDPAAYVEVDLDYPRPAELSDFGGGVRVDGRLVAIVWVEGRAGDELAREIGDELSSRFAGAGAGAVTWLAGGFSGGASRSADGSFYGRRWVVPFVRFS